VFSCSCRCFKEYWIATAFSVLSLAAVSLPRRWSTDDQIITSMFRAYFSRISRADKSNLASVPDVLIFTSGASVGAAVVFADGGRVNSSRLTAARSSNVTKERGFADSTHRTYC
jgi:hypothetical protein